MAEIAVRETGGATRAKPARVNWVDSAKGLCILLVVLGHSITTLGSHGYTTGIWSSVNFFLGPIRMPLFFLLSGLFAAKALSENWTKLANRRIWVMVWLYVLWVPIRDLVNALLPQTHVSEIGVRAPPAIADPGNWDSLLYNSLHATMEPSSYLWFLWALCLFAILTKATRHVPPVLQVLVAAVINVSGPFEGVSWSWDFVAQMYVFYVLGVYAAPWIFRMTLRRPVWSLVASVGAYLAVATWVQLTFPTFNDGNQGLVRLFLSVSGIFAMVNIMALLQNSVVVKPFEALGRRTLPVYLMHIPVLSVMVLVLDLILPADPGLPLQPVVAAVVAAVLCLGLHKLIVRAGGQWLFVRPPWMVRLTTPNLPVPATAEPAAAGEKDDAHGRDAATGKDGQR